MQDDATYKQAKVMVDLAQVMARRTPNWLPRMGSSRGRHTPPGY